MWRSEFWPYEWLGWIGLTPLTIRFTTLSTGGFSTHANSIGYWDSPVIEAVIIGLMLCGGLNYLTSYLILTGKFKAVIRNGEIQLQGVLVLLGALILFLSVATGLYSTLGKAIRVSVFETITALSTTGYATVSYLNWNSLGWLVLILLMMIGGGDRINGRRYQVTSDLRTLSGGALGNSTAPVVQKCSDRTQYLAGRSSPIP